MIAPLLYIWGDDDLAAERLVTRFATALEIELGSPLDRWDLRADLATAETDSARLLERLATPVMFGGGTLAVVSNPGNLVRRNDTRDRVFEAIGLMVPGSALVFVEAARTSAKGPGTKRLADAVKAAGGRIVAAAAPRPTGLGAWIETEARQRGLALASGTAQELADRLGSRVAEGDVDRRFLSRIVSGELDKLALRHAIDLGPVTPDDVRALVAETTPASVWALTDAVGTRGRVAALWAMDRLLNVTPEPVIVAALHRRVRELIEVGDRFAAGQKASEVIAATGLHPFVAEKLQAQSRFWTIDELEHALGGLVDLDAMVKGAEGSEVVPAQRRLAFTMWVHDHVDRR